MTGKDHFDPDEWHTRLETGDRSDPSLALAAKIKEKSPELSGPSLAFQTQLRSRLVDQFAQAAEKRGFAGTGEGNVVRLRTRPQRPGKFSKHSVH